jgi:nitrite reductase (cytochrome c-552)
MRCAPQTGDNPSVISIRIGNWAPAMSSPVKYSLIFIIFAACTAGVTYLLMNIAERKQEAKQHFFKVVDLTEDDIDPEKWKLNFPRQYDGYKGTMQIYKERHGGSEVISRLDTDPNLKRLFAGYAFSIDFRVKRGHAYMLIDQENTERVKQKKQPGACLHCHSSVMKAYRDEGDGDVLVGFKKVCGMEWEDAHQLVKHPVSCVDCHDPNSAAIRVTRPAFKNALAKLASSDDPLPHLPSIEQWRKDGRKGTYDVDKLATRQEMRTFVCAQCHVEYYFHPKTKELIYPWANGLKIDQIEKYYDDMEFTDWVHKDTKTNMLKAQHPEFELWSQGIHARSGVSCADCHMPYMREGAVKISDHHVRSPLLNTARACQVCHRNSEEELKQRVETIQHRTKSLLAKAESAVVNLMDAIQAAERKGVATKQIAAAQAMHRRAQWRVDFIISENSIGFHAPQESARILGEAIDYARQGQMALWKE